MMLFHLFFLMHRHQRKPGKQAPEPTGGRVWNIDDATNYYFVMPACKCNQHRTFCISSKVFNTLLKNTHMLSIQQEKSSSSVVKENTGDSLLPPVLLCLLLQSLKQNLQRIRFLPQAAWNLSSSGPMLHLQDTWLLQDHNYSCVPPWNPLPLFSRPGSLYTQPFTSTLIKASYSQPPRLLELLINWKKILA